MRFEDIVERAVTAIVLGIIAIVLILGLLGTWGCHFHLHVGEKHQYEGYKETRSYEKESGVLDDLAVFERLADEVTSGGPDHPRRHPDH